MEFKREEVMNNLAVACRVFNGTLDQHEYLQKALQWVNSQLEKAEASEAKSELKSVE